MPPIICIEQLGKRYRIRHQANRGGYRRLSEELWNAAKRPFARSSRQSGTAVLPIEETRPATTEDFWALQDVSFDVQPGEVVGIIGRNGAGKSTLLKILSRITEPTTGRVRLRGRLASLLEVGTGFHPELTGRENIYLNGAVLGMTRAEIKRKFDEIVAFAEVEQFLDTPVKRYSSGMYVRLAFAVAAHLEPEILVVDEVLAVGDAEFQKKCLGKMKDVAGEGRTVLFVSHNMNAIESLCSTALLLQRGRAADFGTNVRRIVTSYLTRESSSAASSWINDDNSFDHSVMQPLYFAIEDSAGRPLTGPARNDDRIFVTIRADVRQLDPALNAGFALFNQDSHQLLWSLTTDGPETAWPPFKVGLNEVRCELPRRYLNEGDYRLELIASLHCRDWFVRPQFNSPAIHFEIRGGLSDSPYWLFARPGILAPEWAWVRTN
ncbi:MAG: ABC transporter ATP-binding protein [Planctomycetaceae bacterium]